MLPGTELIPIHDDNPTSRFPYLTLALVILNAGLLLVEPSLGQGSGARVGSFFYRWGSVPWEIVHGHPVQLSACGGTCFPHKNVYLALITSMFLHGGIAHLVGNMVFLWVFGNNIEDALGKARFLAFYLLGGVIASMAHVLANPASTLPSVGASGAISAIMGAYIVLYPRARVTTIIPILFFIRVTVLPAAAVLGIWFLLQLLIGSATQPGGGGVAWMAHVGGFVAGALLILPFGGRPRRTGYLASR